MKNFFKFSPSKYDQEMIDFLAVFYKKNSPQDLFRYLLTVGFQEGKRIETRTRPSELSEWKKTERIRKEKVLLAINELKNTHNDETAFLVLTKIGFIEYLKNGFKDSKTEFLVHTNENGLRCLNIRMFNKSTGVAEGNSDFYTWEELLQHVEKFLTDKLMSV